LYWQKRNAERIYEIELAILREIQLNDSFREDILAVESTPMEWEGADFPLSIKNKILSRLPNYLDCEAKICALNETCSLEKAIKEDIYAQAIAITVNTDSEEFNPRQLRLFCWTGIAPEPTTCADLNGYICTENQICPGIYYDAFDSSRCCSTTCELPQAILTLFFSDVDYSWQPPRHYYTYTRTFTESNSVGVTLNYTEAWSEAQGLINSGTVDYRINANSELIQLNKQSWTEFPSNKFTLKYSGIDDNGYDVYIEQSLCVEGTFFTPNC